LYAQSASGRPTTADRTNHPDGSSALGCDRRPVVVRRVCVTGREEREGREMEPELVLEYT
jgi:hypothetical protein